IAAKSESCTAEAQSGCSRSVTDAPLFGICKDAPLTDAREVSDAETIRTTKHSLRSGMFALLCFFDGQSSYHATRTVKYSCNGNYPNPGAIQQGQVKRVAAKPHIFA